MSIGVNLRASRRRIRLMNSHPQVTVICGSTRFRDEIAKANAKLTLDNRIVVAPGVFGHSGDPMTDQQKVALDKLHFQKIDLAADVYVVCPPGPDGKPYIGESTRREIEYATAAGKPIAYSHPAVK